MATLKNVSGAPLWVPPAIKTPPAHMDSMNPVNKDHITNNHMEANYGLMDPDEVITLTSPEAIAAAQEEAEVAGKKRLKFTE